MKEKANTILSHREVLMTLSAGACGLLLTFVLFLYAHLHEKASFLEKFNLDSKIRASIIIDNLKERYTYLEVTRNFFEASSDVTKEEFATFVRPLIRDSALQAILWAHRIGVHEVNAFESHLSVIEGKKMVIHAGSIKTQKTGTQYPVLYAEPKERNLAILGYDLFREEERRSAIAKAVKNNSTAVSKKVTFVTGGEGSEGVLLVFPVKAAVGQTGFIPGTGEGIVAAGLRLRELVEGSLADTPEIGLHTDIIEITPAGEKEVLFCWSHWKSEPGNGVAPHGLLMPKIHEFFEEFSFAGKKWAIRVQPNASYVKKNFSLYYFYILPIGILLSAVLSLYLWLLYSGKARAEKMAQKIAAELTQKTEEVNKYFNMALDLFCIADTEGVFIKLNPSWEYNLGYTLEELEGKKFLDFVHPDDKKKTLDIMDELSTGKKIIDFINRYRAKDGNYHWIEWRSAIATGKKLIYAAARDVTERKKNEAEIKKSEELFRAAVTNNPSIISIIDKDGICTMAEGKGLALIGLKPGEAIGYSFYESYRDNPEMIKSVKKAFKGEYMIYRTTLNGYIFEIQHVPLHGVQGEISGLLNISANVTDEVIREKEKEKFITELETKNSELERFVYTVSHDLKSPLVTISGFAGLLKKHLSAGKNSAAEEDADFINNAAKTMNGLLEDLLEISKIGRVVCAVEKVYFINAVEEAAKRVRAEVEKKSAVIAYEPELKDEKAKCAWVMADKKRLVEALQNLLSNAVKFSKQDEKPVITFGFREEFRGERCVYFIKDNGIGIEKEYLEKIFGLFERLDPSIEGSGAGLPIVRRIIEVHGGKIWAESEGRGKGTVFYFTVEGSNREGVV